MKLSESIILERESMRRHIEQFERERRTYRTMLLLSTCVIAWAIYELINFAIN